MIDFTRVLSCLGMLLLWGCNDSTGSEDPHQQPASPLSQAEDALGEGAISFCRNQIAVDASCRVNRDGSAYQEKCYVEGHPEFQTQTFNACGHGIVYYRRYLCAQQNINESLFHKITCESLEANGAESISEEQRVCATGYPKEIPSTECVADEKGELPKVICSVPGQIRFTEIEFLCGSGITKYENFLCQTYPEQVTADDLQAIECK